jgi:serine/threonine-protein kinase
MTGNESIVRRAQERVGRILKGKYRLDALLGIGGMAAVYAATHRNGKRAAIKVLHDEMAAVPEIRARFLTEGYVANRVGHPGAVAVIDDETEDDLAFLVMELLDGETAGARARRRGGRIHEGEALSMADQLLDVLAASHDAGIVHRDLKPDNVFITASGQVKVLDFGIARIERGSEGRHTTQVGVAMGTPAFLAPEQARGRWELVDALTDQWAVGASLFALISGRDVHHAPTVNELLLAAMTQQAPPLASVAEVHPMVAAVVDRALAYDKAQRFPDVRAMQRGVRAAIHALGGPYSLVVTDFAPLPAGPAHPWSGHHDAFTGLSVVTERPTSLQKRRLARSAVLGAALAVPAGALLGVAVWWLASGHRGAEQLDAAPAGPAAGAPAISVEPAAAAPA